MLNEEKEVLGYIKEAFALKSQKSYKSAVEMLYKALSMDNDNQEVLSQLGELYVLMHNYQRALGYLEQVLEKNPKHLESLKLVREIYFREEYYSAGLEYAKHVFEEEQNPQNLKYLVMFSGKLNLIGNMQ